MTDREDRQSQPSVNIIQSGEKTERDRTNIQKYTEGSFSGIKRAFSVHIKKVNHVSGKSDSDLLILSNYLKKLFDFKQSII